MTTRAWNDWASRWWTSRQRLELEASVQPVVLIDDVRSLQLPPVSPRFGIGNLTNPPVAGQDPIFLIAPTSRPLIVEEFRVLNASGDMQYIVQLGTVPLFDSEAATDVAVPLVQAAGYNTLAVATAIYKYGSENAVLVGADSPVALSGETVAANILLLPGSYLLLQNPGAVGLSNTLKRLIWRELLGWEQIDTSLSRIFR